MCESVDTYIIAVFIYYFCNEQRKQSLVCQQYIVNYNVNQT